MRNIKISPDEYYHIFNRGSNKQVIFYDKNDRLRFLFLVLYFQSDITFSNIGRSIKEFVQHRVLNKEAEEIVKKRTVELVAFCLMPNHFHLVVKNVEETGIANYMQRVQNSYTKYFNTKYKKSGHLFQGPYKAVHIQDDKQLLYLSAYIHRNPRELKGLLGKENAFQWSSYQDFIGDNRFGALLLPDIIANQFDNKKQYDVFVKESSAKLLQSELEEI
jgi:putative transposase